MKRLYVMAFDAGTGAGRSVIFDLDGRMVASGYAEWGYTVPEDAPERGRVFDAARFWDILARSSREAIARAGIAADEIVGVSTTSQRQGMVFTDAQGREIYAAPNVDFRGDSEVEQVLPHAEEVRAITGLHPWGMWGLARMLWFQKHRRDIYDRIDRVMMISDWVAYRLCGIPACEPSGASPSQLLDLASGDWSPRVAELFHLRTDHYPPVYPSGTRIGVVTAEAAAATGLAAGTVVAAGGGDTQAGLLGMGLTEPGQIGVVAGTFTPVMWILDRPYIDPGQRATTNCHVVPGRWTLESNAGMTGMSFRWVRDTFVGAAADPSALGGVDPYQYMNQQAEQVPTGAGGVVALIGPRRSSRNPRSDLGGFVLPVTYALGQYDLRHWFRASLESLAFGVCAQAEQLGDIVGSRPVRLDACGGQTRSNLYCRTMANALNVPVSTYQVKEASGLGTAICAAVAAGCYQSLQEGAAAMAHIDRTFEPQPAEVEASQAAYRRWFSIGEYLGDYPG